MAAKRSESELETLEKYRVALENAQNQPEIAKELNDIGYGADVIAQGEEKYTIAVTAYNENKREDDETNEAYADFSTLKEEVLDTYKIHRKKAKVIFRNEPIVLDKLALTGIMPKAYVEVMDTLNKFYTTALTDNAIIDKLRKLAITPEELGASNTKVKELESLRADYLREVGESQDATQSKDAALLELSRWMSDFYAVAKIALEDSPQLLEALGITVR